MVFVRVGVRQTARIINLWQRHGRRSTMDGPTTHLQKTALNRRSTDVTEATVSVISTITPTVKLLRLQVRDRCSFKAGQWVDLFLPGVDVAGGYSISTAPQTLVSHGSLDLAVKYSDHPPAKWIHTQCKEGVRVTFRIGGDFYYDAEELAGCTRLLLIAGGVGINPLCSIFRTITALKEDGVSTVQHLRVSLLYSARSQSELQFTDIFDEATKRLTTMKRRYFITGPLVDDCNSADHSIYKSRIGLTHLREELSDACLQSSRAFICGPPSMIENIQSMLVSLGLPFDHIKLEKWW